MKTKSTKVSKSSSALSDSLIEKVCGQIDAISKELAGLITTLSPRDRKRLPKVRTGWEGLVPKLADLATRSGVSVPGVSIDAMLSEMRKVQGLAPFAARVAKLDQSITDSILLAQGNLWQSATALYTVLCRAELVQPDLGTELAPLRAFFALGPRGTGVGDTSQTTDAQASAASDTSKATDNSSVAGDAPAEPRDREDDHRVTPEIVSRAGP